MKQKNIFLTIVDAILLVVTVVVSIALFFGLIARWIDPTTTTFFAFFALGAPLLYLANFLLLCMWTVRWKKIAILPFIVGLVGVGNIGEFVQIKWTKQYDEHKESTLLTIMTYNVHHFRPIDRGSLSTLDQICHQINAAQADVVFVQEYSIADSAQLQRFEQATNSYPYRVYQHDVVKSFAHSGQIILSRHPLSTSRTLAFEATDNCVMTVDLYCSRDTVRLFGCHLQTTAFNSVSGERGLRSMMTDQNSDSLAITAISALADNFRLRSAQANQLAQLIDVSPYSVVVAGDFNSPPLTYTYSTVRGNLSDAFCENAVGYGYTYKPLKGLFRIDYVLFDDDHFDAISYLSPDLPYSDHNPVIVKLQKKIK